MMQQEQEELHSAYCSNQYGYHDLCECDSSPSATTELLDIDIDDFTTSCCIMDTSYDTTAATTTTAMTTSIDDYDHTNTKTNMSFDSIGSISSDDDDHNQFKQLEIEFQPLFGSDSSTTATDPVSNNNQSSDVLVASTYHFESTHEVAGSVTESDEDDDDNITNFEQLEEELQIMTSKLQTNIAKLSIATAATATAAAVTATDDSISTTLLSNIEENQEQNNGSSLIIGSSSSKNNDTTTTESKTTTTTTKSLLAPTTTNEIELQLSHCQDILQQLWNECKEEKKTVVSSNNNKHEEQHHEFMDQVHQYSLYKIQWEILRSEYNNCMERSNQTTNTTTTTNNKPLTHIIDLELMRKKNAAIRRSAGHRHVLRRRRK